MKYNTRHINQSGFRTKHSCVAASTKIADEIIKELDKGNYTGVLLLDIIKKDLIELNMQFCYPN
jgi:hypothetical protein